MRTSSYPNPTSYYFSVFMTTYKITDTIVYIINAIVRFSPIKNYHTMLITRILFYALVFYYNF